MSEVSIIFIITEIFPLLLIETYVCSCSKLYVDFENNVISLKIIDIR